VNTVYKCLESIPSNIYHYIYIEIQIFEYGLKCVSKQCLPLAGSAHRSAHLLSRYRPRSPIIAVTRCGQAARQAHLYRGIYPVLYTKPANDVWAEDVDQRVNFALEYGERTSP
jgi:pyruvate kinase